MADTFELLDERLANSVRNGFLSPFEGILPDLTKRDEPIFTGFAASKSRSVESARIFFRVSNSFLRP